MKIEPNPSTKAPKTAVADGRLGFQAVGRVERPARVDATQQQGQHEENRADSKEVETEQVQPREGHILGPQVAAAE